MRRTPRARMASSTLAVAMVFCSRSLRGCCGAEADIGIGGQMEYEFGALHGAAERPRDRAGRRAPGESAGERQRGSRNSGLARGEIVEAGDLMTVGEQTVHQVTADEAGRAGDQESSRLTFMRVRAGGTGASAARDLNV